MASEKHESEHATKKSQERPGQKAEQLREEISRTRSALSEDVKALGERLHPDQLKEDAKEVIHHAADAAREGARYIVRDAKDAAFDSLRSAKDHAIESLDEVSERARSAGHAASDFVATHAIPLTLLGAGAGWLMISLSHQRRLASRRPRTRQHYELVERAREVSSELGERAIAVGSQITRGASELGHEAADWSRSAYDGLERAGTHAIEVGERNPLTVGLVALAAGAAVAMMLPSTRRENQLLGGTRDRVVRSVQRSAGELKESVQRSVDDVREVIDEMRSPGSTHA